MTEVNPEPLDGILEMDGTYIGGKKIGQGAHAAKKAKVPVFVIKRRGGELRFFKAEDVKSGTLARYIKENVGTDVAVIMTDEAYVYPMAIFRAGIGKPHKSVNHSEGIYANGDITTNGIESAFSLLKRGTVGSWHKVSAKHLPAYLDEMKFRFNDNRHNPYLFRDTMLKLIEATVLEYGKLTAA